MSDNTFGPVEDPDARKCVLPVVALTDEMLRNDPLVEEVGRIVGDVFRRWARQQQCELDGHVVTREFGPGEADGIEWICDRCWFAQRYDEVPA